MSFHRLVNKDSRDLTFIEDETVGLVVTSPPYWNLKEYVSVDGQLGNIPDYTTFLHELEQIFRECFRILLPGGRLVIVVGDVLLSRKEHGRHKLIPLHSDIQIQCVHIGFELLSPIIWYKIGNVNYEGGGSGGLGKPYQPNAIIKNNIEYILMARKPGYRSPTEEQRLASKIAKENFKCWFQQIWTDISGTSSRNHPAPFPEELAHRLICMFSFVGDTIVDPFVGSGSTILAAIT